MGNRKVSIHRNLVGSPEGIISDTGAFKATLSCSDEGVNILKIKSDRVELEILPFQGQQIWSAKIDGRDLTMKSLVTIPVPTSEYLRNYGAFLVHCGATAMGGPSADDTHPLHGELPNAPYNKAWLEVGVDEQGNSFIEVHGQYLHQVAMTCSYDAHPVVRLTQTSNIVDVSMSITNRAGRDMDLMYMAHVNFLPVEDSQIVATHLWDPSSVRVITNLPAHVRGKATPEFLEFLERAGRDPELSSKIPSGMSFDPELVAEVDYLSDEQGIGHTLIVHPDGASDYMGQVVESLPLGIRYLQRTPDHDCVGTGPSTSGVTGKLSESQKGTVKTLTPGETFQARLQFGALDIAETKGMQTRIADVIGTTR